MLIFAWIVLSVKTAQRNLYNNRGAPLHPPARPLAAIHHLRASPLDLCPAAACTVHCCLTKNKVILYGNLEARIFERTRRSIQIDNTKGAPPASRIGRKVRQLLPIE